jgi:hypothetical protein
VLLLHLEARMPHCNVGRQFSEAGDICDVDNLLEQIPFALLLEAVAWLTDTEFLIDETRHHHVKGLNTAQSFSPGYWPVATA